jgi:DNA-binding response OmpR family regulator
MKRARILVIENDEALAAEAVTVLEAAGYDTMVAADDLDGVGKIYEKYPDLIIMGRQLPPAKGEDAYLRVRQASYIPIIVVGDDAEAVDILESGADACISAPLSPIELVARVRSLLRRKQAIVLFPESR